MIIGFNISPLHTLQKLSLSSYKFYLTGSRFFSTSNPDSDWDFFTQNVDTSQWNWLKRLGFKRLSMHPDWYDELCEAIFHHDDGIDISMVSNAEMKNRAQIYILDMNKGKQLQFGDRDQRRLLWNEAYIRSVT